MRVEFKGQYTKCDCCGERVEERNPFYIKCTKKFSKSSIKINEMDICTTCSTMILENLFKNLVVTEEQIKENMMNKINVDVKEMFEMLH